MQRTTSKRPIEDANEPSGQVARIGTEDVSVLDSELDSATLSKPSTIQYYELAEQYQDKVNSRLATLPMDIVRYLLDPMCCGNQKGTFGTGGTNVKFSHFKLTEPSMSTQFDQSYCCCIMKDRRVLIVSKTQLYALIVRLNRDTHQCVVEERFRIDKGPFRSPSGSTRPLKSGEAVCSNVLVTSQNQIVACFTRYSPVVSKCFEYTISVFSEHRDARTLLHQFNPTIDSNIARPDSGTRQLQVSINAEDQLLMCDPNSIELLVFSLRGERLKTLSYSDTLTHIRWPFDVHVQSDCLLLTAYIGSYPAPASLVHRLSLEYEYLETFVLTLRGQESTLPVHDYGKLYEDMSIVVDSAGNLIILNNHGVNAVWSADTQYQSVQQIPMTQDERLRMVLEQKHLGKIQDLEQHIDHDMTIPIYFLINQSDFSVNHISSQETLLNVSRDDRSLEILLKSQRITAEHTRNSTRDKSNVMINTDGSLLRLCSFFGGLGFECINPF